MTAAELARKLEANPEFVAKRQAREKEFAERISRHQVEETSLIAELDAAGINVKRVSDLINTSDRYDSAIPILIKHLFFPYQDWLLETIARALAVPEAHYAWPTLVAEYRKAKLEEGKNRSGLKDGLAVALSVIATEDKMEEMIELAKDRSHGSSRVLLLRALKKSKSVAAKQAITELASDPDLKKEIASWRRR